MRNRFSQFLFICLKAKRQVTMNQRFSSKERRVYGNRNLLTKIKCFLSLGEIIVHPNLGALNKPSLTMVKKNYSSSTFAFIGILPLPGHSRFVKIYLTLQSLPAFYFSLQLLS